MDHLWFLSLLALFGTSHTFPQRNEKLVGLFNYVTFPNDVCVGDGTVTGSDGDLSGNCYTSQECETLGGAPAGDCAEGYGVCCVFRLSCGQTIKQNLSYFILEETQAPQPSPCSYTICPVASDVNRIRLDFTVFQIGNPVLLADTSGAATGSNTIGSSLGDCVDDTFSVSSSEKGSPVICGLNTGQHMIVDTDGTTCVKASFSFGGDTLTRQYEVRVLQYGITNSMGGPPGCLQFHIGTTGAVTTFNWNANLAGTHLSNQHYNICVRRGRGMCAICWIPSTLGSTATTTRGSFGLSNQNDNAATVKSAMGTDCTTDFIIIPNGEPNDGTLADPVWRGLRSNNAVKGNNKFCGRYLNPTDDQNLDLAVCSRLTPFTLTVVTDANEAVGAAGTAGMAGQATTNEASANDNSNNYPLGTMGFSINYSQQACL